MNQQEKQGYIFGQLFILANRLQYLGDQFDKQISLKQWGLLATLSKFEGGSASIGQVAGFIGSSGQNVKKMAAILERKDFITMHTDKKDSRIVKLTLTQKAIEHAQGRAEREDHFIETLYQGMDESLLEAMCAGLKQLEKNMKLMEEDETK